MLGSFQSRVRLGVNEDSGRYLEISGRDRWGNIDWHRFENQFESVTQLNPTVTTPLTSVTSRCRLLHTRNECSFTFDDDSTRTKACPCLVSLSRLHTVLRWQDRIRDPVGDSENSGDYTIARLRFSGGHTRDNRQCDTGEILSSKRVSFIIIIKTPSTNTLSILPRIHSCSIVRPIMSTAIPKPSNVQGKCRPTERAQIKDPLRSLAVHEIEINKHLSRES